MTLPTPAEPVSVTEPPSPSETVTPNDVWTIRLCIGGLVLAFIVSLLGTFVLVLNDKQVPDAFWPIIGGVGGSLGTLATTRGVRAGGNRQR